MSLNFCIFVVRKSNHNFIKGQSFVFFVTVLLLILSDTIDAKPVINYSSSYLKLRQQLFHYRQHQQHHHFQTSTPKSVLHHVQHRSISTMDEENDNFCQEVKSHLKDLSALANISYKDSYWKLQKYTEELFNKKPETQNSLWSKHSFNLNHPLKEHLPDLNGKIDDKKFSELKNNQFSKKTFEEEIRKIYITLLIINNTITDVINLRKANQDQSSYEEKNRLNDIIRVLTEVGENVDQNIRTAVEAMTDFDIPTITTSEEVKQAEYTNRDEVLDWLVIREHMCIMSVIKHLYNIFYSKCSQ